MIMLAWLMMMALPAFDFKILRSTSMPTTNMKRIRPSWLNNCKVPKEFCGKRNALQEGKANPKREGPKNIPAAISPITAGWPIFLNKKPNTRAVNMIAMICSSKMDKDPVAFCTMR